MVGLAEKGDCKFPMHINLPTSVNFSKGGYRGKSRHALERRAIARDAVPVPLLPDRSYVSSAFRVSRPDNFVEQKIENNGRTFYYQIDLWISSRAPTTEVYTTAGRSFVAFNPPLTEYGSSADISIPRRRIIFTTVDH